MNEMQKTKISCPYCGEPIDILLDSEEVDAPYIEDCQVCCRPIHISLYEDEGGNLNVQARHENEA
ncbi:CPXCG motif-containing cysteine-rich protein [Parendozoicomonas sp. Alg238-R29]|uniref:CPXCG motif-containing cysteine-rich protein n=1 Tax=Parendozoicomonas sp. Alg238-R29 TaxID=2993446 RepID=UPI00248DFD59|nr:CPXCG motif-containing cysteine-rich protein [Parendozoicomonas sp. Alg238-R29]